MDNLDPEFSTVGAWYAYGAPYPCYGSNFAYSDPGTGADRATFRPEIPIAASYEVFLWWGTSDVGAANEPVTINYDGGSQTLRINVQGTVGGGGYWLSLGTFPFAAGNTGSIVVSDDADGYVMADAVRLVQQPPIPDRHSTSVLALRPATQLLVRCENMPRALFFPSYLGSGFGHVGRCLALAGELSARGWEVAFTLSGPHLARVHAAGYPVYEPKKPFRPRAETREGLAFTIFSDMNFQLVRDGFHHPRVVRATVKEGLRFVSRFRPDVLVGDTWPLTSVMGRRAGLPVVQIIKSVVHPAQPNLIWWEQPPPGLRSPDPRPIFNPVLRRWGLPEITRAEDLLTGDLLLVPSIPELDPLPPDLPDTYYVGALITSEGAFTQKPPWFADLDASRPLLYVTIGGGAGPVGGRRFFALVAEAFADTVWQVIVSTSAKFSSADLPVPPPNVRFESWVPGLAVIARSDVVMFHGGYGTTMECVRYGVPSVVIPFHSEQESNGRRLEACGAGLVLLPSSAPPQPAPGRWAGDEFVTLVRRSSDLTALQLRQAVEEVWTRESYRQNAERLRDELARYGGPTQAAELIAALVT